MSDNPAMTCSEYRRLYPKFTDYPLPKEIWDTEEYETWSAHGTECLLCYDWSRDQVVRKRGYSVHDFPCLDMAYYVTFRCDEHADPWDCTDYIVVYNPRFNEYGIPIRDGGSSMVNILHCPWCGIQLSESRRDEYIERLEATGFDEFLFNDEIPEEYRTDKWWRGKTTMEDWWPFVGFAGEK